MTDLRPLDAGEDAGPDIVRLIGAQLKSLRMNAQLEREEFAARVGYSTHTVISVEQGLRRPPEPDFLDRADEVLRAGGLLKLAKREVAKACLPAFFRDAARLEERAVEYHSYENQVVPGLLQTREYARALFRMRRPMLDEETVEERTAARLARQALLDRTPAPTMSFVLEEAVLHRPLGGREVLRAQREHLLRLARQPNIELQVMPTGREDHAGSGGPLLLLRAEGEPMAAYVEAHGLGVLHTRADTVRDLSQRYEILRAQALGPRESARLIERLPE